MRYPDPSFLPPLAVATRSPTSSTEHGGRRLQAGARIVPALDEGGRHHDALGRGANTARHPVVARGAPAHRPLLWRGQLGVALDVVLRRNALSLRNDERIDALGLKEGLLVRHRHTVQRRIGHELA